MSICEIHANGIACICTGALTNACTRKTTHPSTFAPQHACDAFARTEITSSIESRCIKSVLKGWYHMGRAAMHQASFDSGSAIRWFYRIWEVLAVSWKAVSIIPKHCSLSFFEEQKYLTTFAKGDMKHLWMPTFWSFTHSSITLYWTWKNRWKWLLLCLVTTGYTQPEDRQADYGHPRG